MRRVVASGVGVVTALGSGREKFWRALTRGESGEARAKRFSFPETSSRAYPVQDLEDHEALDPFVHYALEAVREAVRDSGACVEQHDPLRVGVVMGSSKGGMVTLARLAERVGVKANPVPAAELVSNVTPNAACQEVAREFNIQGPSRCYSLACATGTASLIEGWHMVSSGEVDLAIAGASDASITPLLMAGYERLGVLSHGALCPFDRSRSGFLLGEGAAAVIFEPLEAVAAEGRSAYAEVLAGAYGQDAHHAVQFAEENHTLSRTLANALARAGLEARDVDYVNAHAAGTVQGDRYEAREYRRFFAGAAGRAAFGSTKGATGHLLGASGAVEAVSVLLAVKGDVVLPTANLEDIDPECELSGLSARPQARRLGVALSVSLGFGGHAACIVFKKL